MKTSYEFKDTLQRQWDLIPMEVLSKRITIIGAGAVGSWTALALAKMGFLNLEIWDDDEIDVVNMNCQFYPVTSIGEKKVIALQDMINMFTGHKVNVVSGKYEGTSITGDIVISAVDNMEVRKSIWDNSKATWFIDPRMGAESLLLYTMKRHDPADMETYSKTLHTDGEGVQERCTAKSTIYCSNILSGLAARAVKQIATGQPHTRIVNGALSSDENIILSWGKK
jgi:molybdopterin/thiamine biosynthesis adenylyltransferase